jgi:YfiR/HmsC-like
LLGLGLLLNSSQSAFAQTLEEQTVLAALALNVVRFTSWPAETQAQMKNTVDFCVVGDNLVQQSFTTIDNKAIGDKTIHIINLSRLRNYEQCHVLYISELQNNIVLQIFAETKNRPLLTIGESYNFAAQGGMVGMENVDEKIILHVNLQAVNESKLTISARLLKLAKIIGK